MERLDGSAGQTNWMDQLDGPVLFTSSLDQFAYSKINKIDLSVCTLSQLPSPTKALFFKVQLVFGCVERHSPERGNQRVRKKEIIG